MSLSQIAEIIFRESLADCSIEKAFEQKIRLVEGDHGHQLLLSGQPAIDLNRVKHIRIVSAGKAAGAMLQALLSRIQGFSKCDISGVLIARERPANLPQGIQFFLGGHPFPNEASFAGAHAALTMLRSLQESRSKSTDTLCFFLISGGASAMMELPLDPAISLADTISFHRELVHCGASIAQINCVRKHFSAIKGGRLGVAAEGIPSLSLLVSDVPPGQLDALASGPTLPDSSTLSECREILARYNLLGRFAPSVQRFFTSSELQETPKPGDLKSPVLALLSAADLAEFARKRAEAFGFRSFIDNTCDDWDYRTAAKYLLDRLRILRREYPRVCLISAGEVTVKLPSITAEIGIDQCLPFGAGGRNQHFCLYAATLLNNNDASTVILSAGSDGVDGHSEAAGAVVGEQTIGGIFTPKSGGAPAFLHSHCHADAQRALNTFDSSTFLEGRNATIVTGPTGNNLRDLRILLADQSSSETSTHA